MYADAITDVATIGARPVIEWHGQGSSASGVEVFPLWQPTWRSSLISKVSAYRSLPHNWNSYGSPAPTSIAVAKALHFIGSALNDSHIPPRVTPVSGGGIQFEWSRGGREIEIEILPDGTTELLVADNDEEDSQIETTLQASSPEVMNVLLSWLTNSQ